MKKTKRMNFSKNSTINFATKKFLTNYSSNFVKFIKMKILQRSSKCRQKIATKFVTIVLKLVSRMMNRKIWKKEKDKNRMSNLKKIAPPNFWKLRTSSFKFFEKKMPPNLKKKKLKRQIWGKNATMAVQLSVLSR